jgi:hypothetical protein
VPRVPSPNLGVTSVGETLAVSWESITPPSLLVRTHAPIPTRSSLLRFMAYCEKSLQVATSPCCQWDFPDVISANPSLDARSPTPAVPQDALACFFSCVIGLPHVLTGSASRIVPLNDFSAVWNFGAADIFFMFWPPDLLALQIVPTAAVFRLQGSQGFYFRAEHASLPPHASDMLAV